MYICVVGDTFLHNLLTLLLFSVFSDFPTVRMDKKDHTVWQQQFEIEQRSLKDNNMMK